MKTTDIRETFSVRKINEKYVDFLAEDFKRNGFQKAYPVSVTENGVLWDGNHRYQAAIKAGLDEIPAIVETPTNIRIAAHERNRVSMNALPETFVDHAEEIWAMLAGGMTQQAVAGELGWSRGKVSQYAMLGDISLEAWNVVATQLQRNVAIDEDGRVANGATNVAFSEGLLRPITCLTPDQQVELVEAVSREKDPISKQRFTTLAKCYKARNEMDEYVLDKLTLVDDPCLLCKAFVEIDKGAYDKDWMAEKRSTSKLDSLVKSINDEWEKKNNIHLIHGDFYEETKKIQDETIDLVLTDPPYNLDQTRVVRGVNRSDISKDFGEWDHDDGESFIAVMREWMCEFKRIMRPGGTGIVFTSTRFISHLRTIAEDTGLENRMDFYWCKKNPAPKAVETNDTNAVEVCLIFTKGGNTHTYHWPGQADSLNYALMGICQGDERVKDGKGNILHPTQKPEALIRLLMERRSNRGDMVFDGFMGVGTTPRVAKDTGRKCIAIEQDKSFYEAATRRLHD